MTVPVAVDGRVPVIVVAVPYVAELETEIVGVAAAFAIESEPVAEAELKLASFV